MATILVASLLLMFFLAQYAIQANLMLTYVYVLEDLDTEPVLLLLQEGGGVGDQPPGDDVS